MAGQQSNGRTMWGSRYCATDSSDLIEVCDSDTAMDRPGDSQQLNMATDDATARSCCVSSPFANIKQPGMCTWCQRECRPHFALALAHFGATLLFLGGVNMDCLPHLPFPLLGSFLPQRFQKHSEIPVVAVILLWGFHFLRRSTEVLFLQTFRRRYSCKRTLAFTVYLHVFGLWIGWSVNFVLGGDIHKIYKPPPYTLVAFGALIFIIGEIGNCASHWMFSKFQSTSQILWTTVDSLHVLPYGFLFKYVSSPHYFFELLTWLGFAIATCTLSSAVFFALSSVVLVYKARVKHREYLEEFDGKNGRPDYKKLRRKIILPGIY